MNQLPHDRRRPASRRELLRVVGIVAAITVAIIVLWVFLFGWKGTGFQGQTLWDWLKLLIIPAALALVGFLFNRWETRAAQAAAEERAQEEAWQAYLDEMSQMIADKDQPLREYQPDDPLRVVAQARTRTLLRRLDAQRKREVVQFLSEAELIQSSHIKQIMERLEKSVEQDRQREVEGKKDDTTETEPSLDNLVKRGFDPSHAIVVSLEQVDLSDADLHDIELTNVNMAKGNLSRANLSKARLPNAQLSDADLTEADLRDTLLRHAKLFRACLRKADLRGADLSGASLTNAKLSDANLRDAKLTFAKMDEAILQDADLREADLQGNVKLNSANLRGANMSGANLNSADLQDADLEGANLQDADLAYAEFQGASLKNTVLTGAKIWTEERLRSAASLEGATMPDGRTLRGDETPEGPTFEIWVKDKKAAKEDRGNE